MSQALGDREEVSNPGEIGIGCHCNFSGAESEAPVGIPATHLQHRATWVEGTLCTATQLRQPDECEGPRGTVLDSFGEW